MGEGRCLRRLQPDAAGAARDARRVHRRGRAVVAEARFIPDRISGRHAALASGPRAARGADRMTGKGRMMTLQRRRFLQLVAATAVLPGAASAQQSYPDRPVRVVVPYAPGGPTDVVTRLLVQKISDRTGKQFFVENIGGGGGNIAMGRVAKM